MSDRKTNFLVTLVFDENTHIGNQIDTEFSFKNEIIKDLQHLIKGSEIKHFVIADDEVINDKLKEEHKKGKWIYHKRSISTGFKDLRECSRCKCYFDWLMPRNSYCPNCGADMREVK